MQFALVNGERLAPIPRVSGTCPACGSPVVARCGTVRVHHWAHGGDRNCDAWWERETQWHRDWKNNFTEESREVVMADSLTGERHIADVRTEHHLVVEFQHSHLHPEERVSREQFYKNMAWIVDGSRLKGDRPRFLRGTKTFRRLANGIAVTESPQSAFPKGWLNCEVPVFFDFGDEPDEVARKGPLYCLLPGRVQGNAVVVTMERQEFVRLARTRTQPLPLSVEQLSKFVQEAMIAHERAWLAEQQMLLNELRNYQRRGAHYIVEKLAHRRRHR